MRTGLRRSLADAVCRLLQAILPVSLESWGWAIRYETSGIPDDTEALVFALDSLCGLLPRTAASYLLSLFTSQTRHDALFTGGPTPMNIYRTTLRRPRILGMICATGAVILGLVYMAMAGAPARYLGINAAALLLGLTALALLGRTPPRGGQWTSLAIAAMAGILIATALLGAKVEGASRWVNLGGVSIQPSLILLPVMLVAFVRNRNGIATTGIIATAIAMALQPDRSMAAMLAVGLAVLAIMRPERHVIVGLGASVAGFAATLVRPDTLPAAPYVDQIFYSAFEVDPAAGAAVLGGSALLLIPAIVGWSREPANRETYAVFGGVWLAAIMAAALGNYPTPIVGYGGSAIIGYALSLLSLPGPTKASVGATTETSDQNARPPVDRHLLVRVA